MTPPEPGLRHGMAYAIVFGFTMWFVIAFTVLHGIVIAHGVRYASGCEDMDRITKRPTVLYPRGEGCQIFIDEKGRKSRVWGGAVWVTTTTSVSTSSVCEVAYSSATWTEVKRVRVRSLEFGG